MSDDPELVNLKPISGYLDWVSKLKSKKMIQTRNTSDIATRKYNYEQSFSDIGSIERISFKWEFEFPEYLFDWVLNFEFNFLIDLILNFDISINDELTSSFSGYFENLGMEFEVNLDFEFEQITKGYFGKSKYGYAYFDPPNITPEDILKYLKEFRKKLLNNTGYEYRFTKDAMKKVISAYSSILSNEAISENFIEFIISKLLIVESKLRYNSYVDLAIVGFSTVLPATQGSTGVGIAVVRDRETLEPSRFIESNGLIDTVVGYAHVGYSRVSISRDVLYSEYGAEENRPAIPPALRDKYLETMDMGRNMLGVVDVVYQGKPLPHLPARRRLLMKGKEIALKGGVHQAIMQSYIQKVKQILDREGIVGVERLNYISFANEVLYLRYEGNRKNKTWKRNISIDSLVEKYITLGAKEDILWKVVKICQR